MTRKPLPPQKPITWPLTGAIFFIGCAVYVAGASFILMALPAARTSVRFWFISLCAILFMAFLSIMMRVIHNNQIRLNLKQRQPEITLGL